MPTTIVVAIDNENAAIGTSADTNEVEATRTSMRTLEQASVPGVSPFTRSCGRPERTPGRRQASDAAGAVQHADPTLGAGDVELLDGIGHEQAEHRADGEGVAEPDQQQREHGPLAANEWQRPAARLVGHRDVSPAGDGRAVPKDRADGGLHQAATRRLKATTQIALVGPDRATSTPAIQADDLCSRRHRPGTRSRREPLPDDQDRHGTEHGGVGEHERRRRQECDDVDLADREHVEGGGDRDRRDEQPFDDVAADDQPATVAAIGERSGDDAEHQVRHDPEREEQAPVWAAEPVASYTMSGSTTMLTALPTMDRPSATAQRTNAGSLRSRSIARVSRTRHGRPDPARPERLPWVTRMDADEVDAVDEVDTDEVDT